MRKPIRLAIVIALCVTASLMLGQFAARAAGEPIKFNLEAENNSGETGTATLTDLGNGKTMVLVEINGEPDGAAQPMHIHQGQCGPTLGKVVFPLTDLQNGKSTTTVDAALETLTTGGFAINGHKSAQEISVYVFCGNIPSSDAMMMQSDATATHEAMMQGDATATSEAMMMAEATATHEAMMQGDATATSEAMMMAEATATHEAMMQGDATATSDAMMMAEATATHEAMMQGNATATSEAMMMAEATATPEAMMAGEATATPEASAPATVPTTGGTDGSFNILLVGLLGLAALVAGLVVRQTVRKS